MAIEDRLDVVEPDMVDGKKSGSSSGTGREDAHHVVTTSSHGEGGGVDNVSHACGEEERNMDARRKMLGENMVTTINYYGYKRRWKNVGVMTQNTYPCPSWQG